MEEGKRWSTTRDRVATIIRVGPSINPPGDSSVALNMVQKWLRQAQLATTSIYADAE
jgi:hypothetical protein